MPGKKDSSWILSKLRLIRPTLLAINITG